MNVEKRLVHFASLHVWVQHSLADLFLYPSIQFPVSVEARTLNAKCLKSQKSWKSETSEKSFGFSILGEILQEKCSIERWGLAFLGYPWYTKQVVHRLE